MKIRNVLRWLAYVGGFAVGIVLCALTPIVLVNDFIGMVLLTDESQWRSAIETAALHLAYAAMGASLIYTGWDELRPSTRWLAAAAAFALVAMIPIVLGEVEMWWFLTAAMIAAAYCGYIGMLRQQTPEERFLCRY